MPAELDDLQRKLLKLAAQFDGPARKRILATAAKPLERDIDLAVRSDLGDMSMSGWRRGRPIRVVGAVKVASDSLTAAPARGAGGPMRVLDVGRNQGGASGFHGPGVNVRTGATRRTKAGGVAKVRARGGRRANGRTRGKRTWGDAVKRMTTTVPRELEKAIVKEVRGVWRG